MSAVGIFDAAYVVFYHPLDSFTEYTQGQVWTGSGGFVPGKIGSPPKAVSAATADSFNYGALNAYDTDVDGHTLAKIDSSRALLAFKDGTVTKVRVLTVSGTNVTAGPEFTAFTGTDWWGIGLTMLDGTRFLIAAQDASDSSKCRIGTVSGTDVTFGSKYAYAPWLARGTYALALDSSRVAIAYVNYAGATEQGNIIVATVSGTDITLGTTNIFDTGLYMFSIGMSLIDSGRAALTWRKGTVSKLAVASFSGADVTYGTAAELISANSTGGRTGVATLTSTKVVAMYGSTADSNSTRIRVATISGTDVTLGPDTLFQSASFSGPICALDSQTFAIIFWKVGLLNRAPAIAKGTVSGTSVTFGGASTPWAGNDTNPLDTAFGILAMSDTTVLGAVSNIFSPFTSSVAVGILGLESAMTAPTPGAYPTAVGATRVAAAMWAKKLTGAASTVTVERGYRIDMTPTTISLGGTTAVWSGAGIAALMASLNSGVGEAAKHLLVLDFENTAGTTWRLRTSLDGAPWVDQGLQTSGSQVVATTNTAPKLAIAAGEADQWIDELVLWVGDKAAFALFAPDELANLQDLADVFGAPMNQYEEYFGAPICWQATARMPDGSSWRDSGCGPCPPVVRVPRGASDVVVTDDGAAASPRIVEG